MPNKDPKKRKKWHSDYHKKHREEILARQRKWYKKNKEKRKLQQKESSKRTRQKQKRIVFDHYSGGCKAKCACCGIDDIEFLSIDHINGGGTKHRKNDPKFSKNTYKYLIEAGFPEGYRVLCMNCNFSLGHFGYCPHQKKETS